MSNSFFDLDKEFEDNKIIDVSKLSDDSKLIYNTYLEITGLKELPESDFFHLNQVVRNYYAYPLSIFLKNTIATYPSFVKAKSENKIKNFYYVLNFLNMIKDSNIKKINFEQQFKDIPKFLEDNSLNESFIVLKGYIDDGKISILNSDDTKDMYNIFNFYSPEEIELSIKNCKNNGSLIYNLKFLYSVLKNNKADRERYEKNWEIEIKDMKANIESLFSQKDYIEEETIEDKQMYSKMSEQLIEEIKRFKA